MAESADGIGYWRIVPVVVIRPIAAVVLLWSSVTVSVNHKAPSRPVMILFAQAPAVGIGNRVTAPWVVIRPIV